jgi:hypothetical protein
MRRVGTSWFTTDVSKVLKKGDRHLASPVNRGDRCTGLGASPLFQRAVSRTIESSVCFENATEVDRLAALGSVNARSETACVHFDKLVHRSITVFYNAAVAARALNIEAKCC